MRSQPRTFLHAMNVAMPTLSDDTTLYWIQHQQQLQRLLSQLNQVPTVITFPVSLDPAWTLADGGHDTVCESIKRFRFVPLRPAATDYHLVCLHRRAPIEDGLLELANRQLVPGGLFEAYVFGKLYPDHQRSTPVLAPGSHWLDNAVDPMLLTRCPPWLPYVPCLTSRTGKDRHFGVRNVSEQLHEHDTILALAK